MTQLTQNKYLVHAEAALDAIEETLDASGVDIDCERHGHVLTMDLEEGGKIIVSLQIPLQEIWLATKIGASHYRYQDGAWRNTRDGSELFTALSTVSAQLGIPVQFKAF